MTEEFIRESSGRTVYYDRDGEEHHNIISAIHKSLRDGDGDAGCYWIGRMLAGGEDPLYIARRLLRFASEDVGLADPSALRLALTVYESIARIGMPECEIFLYELAYYLADAPKDNLVYRISHMIHDDIAQYGHLPVPMNIRNAPTKLMKSLGYGAGYRYAHDERDAQGNVPTIDQPHFPEGLGERKYRAIVRGETEKE